MYRSSLFFLLLVAYVSAAVSYQKANATARPSTRPASSNRVTSARSDFHHGYEHHYPHHYGGGHLGGLGHYKELDHYLLPMIIMLGIGVLLMPLISVFMSTMVGNVPVTTLVSGRRKRETVVKPVSSDTIMDLWKKVGKAIEVFTKDDK